MISIILTVHSLLVYKTLHRQERFVRPWLMKIHPTCEGFIIPYVTLLGQNE